MDAITAAHLKPLIYWDGFPPCALIIKHFVDLFGDRVVVLGTRPTTPSDDLERMLGHPVRWLPDADDIWDQRERYADRNLIVHSGWGHPGWLKFDRWMKKRGAKVILAADNRFNNSLRQWVGAIWFRLWLRRHFDGALVPGRSGVRLLRFLGMPRSQIYTGLYGAHEDLYSPGPSMDDRRHEFLFVGQLIPRKGLDVLLEAFRRYRARGGTWSLRILGAGPMQPLCQGEGVVFEGFASAGEVAARMRWARCLVTPSRGDNWATVVCEAAACGSLLIASRWVGASEDLIHHGVNGLIVHEMSAEALATALWRLAHWDRPTLEFGRSVSIGVAGGYTSRAYCAAVLDCAASVRAGAPA